MPSPPSSPGGGRPTYRPYVSSDALEKARKLRNKRFGLFAVAAVAAVAFSALWNPPTGRVHDFTKASDYKIESESGCTNSGEGCHGSETKYTDFNDYHPEADCTTCHDYEGVGCIPCHKPREHECQVCHDGSLEAAPDRVKLTDPYPRGHYRETTHTAMGTEMDQVMRGAEDGRAKAKCKDCHSRSLVAAHTGVPVVEGSEYGTDIGCGECHNDLRSFGQAEVLSDWEKRRCEDCHKTNSSSAMHSATVASSIEATGALGCGETGSGCHEDTNLHSLHADSPKTCGGRASKGEPGCHNLEVEAHAPTARGCGGSADTGCHQGYVNDDFSHEDDTEKHSPEDRDAALNIAFHATACGECHFMEPDGVSLTIEHNRATSARSNDSNSCQNCHNDPASEQTIADKWPESDTAAACDACHGSGGLDAPHAANLSALHVAENSSGCADSGDGCHPDSDLQAIGDPIDGGLHGTCLRCHAKSQGDGNAVWNPADKSCGAGGSCHGYNRTTSVHNRTSGRIDGSDAVHRTSAINSARLADTVTGLDTPCLNCHSDELGPEHSRPSNTIAAGTSTTAKVNVCAGCHNATETTVYTVKTSWPDKNTTGCQTCHGTDGVPVAHSLLNFSHGGRELAENGDVAPGSCVKSGCHTTTDVRVLHRRQGCTAQGCHANTKGIFGLDTVSCGGDDADRSCHVGYSALGGHQKVAASHRGVELDLSGAEKPGFCARSGCHTSANLKSVHGSGGCDNDGCHESGLAPQKRRCGGADGETSCHVGFSATEHFVDHSADLTGTVNGIPYGVGTNQTCLSCHQGDLIDAHTATEAGPITGGGASPCRVCHDDQADMGNGDYAGLSAVKSAIEKQDHRCITCHRSGSEDPDANAAASPHKNVSDEQVLPDGQVWSDPLDDWNTALSSPTGGGHNVRWPALSGTKRFPITTYDAGSKTYTWAMIPNSGTTTWLKNDALDGAPVSTLAEIRDITVSCDDCHIGTESMAGPHGSAVKIAIDPEYSQTEYANPTRGRKSQFETTGTERVICFKCHTIAVGSVEGTTSPGGHYVHRVHSKHAGVPEHKLLRYGEKCVDCHVRIPHAWRSPRLLARTISSEGRPADTFPYISKDYDGLAGIVLRDYESPGALRAASCATGGCHGYHGETSHPLPEDIPSASYWP